jgi:formylglycine-generating enzyme required for sulfatase activity
MREGSLGRVRAAARAAAWALFLLLQFTAAPSPANAQAEPAPQAIADQLRLEMVQALERKDYATVLERAETYRALESEGVKMPAGLYFAEAEAAKASGDWLRARAALAAYLERADAADPLYPEALALYPVVETEIARQYAEEERLQREAREREQRARAEREAAARQRAIEELVQDLVAIPGGRFRMGDHSKRGDEDERPVHRVEVPSFMIGRHEVSFEQFDAFCAATGRTPPDDRGWGRDRRPVMNVSFDDALEFLAWAGQQTGQRLRLPTEAEWEYAARAGTETDYWWGDAWSADHANAAGTAGRDGWNATAPVGEFPANPFGLHDMSGNVREWVQDCWTPGYSSKPSTAAARSDGDCSRRVVRGGSWNLGPAWQRSANRDFDDRAYRYVDRGFRVARDL